MCIILLTLSTPLLGNELCDALGVGAFLMANFLGNHCAHLLWLKTGDELGHLAAHFLGNQVTLLPGNLNGHLENAKENVFVILFLHSKTSC